MVIGEFRLHSQYRRKELVLSPWIYSTGPGIHGEPGVREGGPNQIYATVVLHFCWPTEMHSFYPKWKIIGARRQLMVVHPEYWHKTKKMKIVLAEQRRADSHCKFLIGKSKKR